MTRLGDLLDFGQLFKAFGNNYFAQISDILFCKWVKIYHFWSTFIDIWRFFLVTLNIEQIILATLLEGECPHFVAGRW